MDSTTPTTINPNRIIEHAGAPGLGAIWPWLVAIGAAVVVLMVITESGEPRDEPAGVSPSSGLVLLER